MSSSNFSKSPKIKRNKLEIDIEKCRSECKWFRARDLVTPLKNEKSSSALGSLYALVMAEVKLEVIANERDNVEIEEAREIKDYIDDALSSIDDGYKMEAKIQLAKLRFLQHKYQEAINSLDALNLKSYKIDQVHGRLTKLIAEGFAIIGLSVEEVEGVGNGEQMNKEAYEKAMECLELAGDLCIYHVQEVDKLASFGTMNVPNIPSNANIAGSNVASIAGSNNNDQNECHSLISTIVSRAIQHSPILAIRHQQLNRAVSRYRQLLRYSETDSTKSARQSISRQLAEVLMRGVCPANYEKCVVESERASSLMTSTAAMWRVPSKYPSERYTPQEHSQEIVLLLLISEYLANQDAVLNRSPELRKARISTLHNSQSVYDLLAIALARRHCYSYLSQLLQHALRFSYKEWHTWYQLAVCLISARHHQHAYQVLKECQRIDDTKPMPFVLAAYLCLESLQLIEEGLVMAERARDMSVALGNTSLIGRTRVLVARALSLLAQRARVIADKRQLQSLVITELQAAAEADPNDYLCRYLLAVELATGRQLRQSLQSCLAAIRLSPQHCPSLHLLALLHSATGRLQEAATVIDGALIDHPTNISLHKTRAKLQLALLGRDSAIKAYRGVLEAYKEQENELGPQYTVTNGSIVASRIETGSSNIGQCFMAPGGASSAGAMDDTKYGQMEAMLGLAELYLDCDKMDEAKKCLDSISSLGSHYQLLFLRARVLEQQSRIKEARVLYENALAINSTHLGALQRLGKVLQRLGQYQLSEKTLREALCLDHNHSKTWQLLGELFTEMCAHLVRDHPDAISCVEADEQYSRYKLDERTDSIDVSDIDPDIITGSVNVNSHREIVAFATKCLTVAADLELTEPIESFYILPRSVKQF